MTQAAGQPTALRVEDDASALIDDHDGCVVKCGACGEITPVRFMKRLIEHSRRVH